MDKNGLKEAFERSRRALELKPAIAKRTASCTVRVIDGFTCSMEEGPWRIVGDASEKVGGNALGPDPSQLVRMAFGSCAATAYVQWAAVLGIELDEIEVVVETEHDYRGYYDVADVPVGPLEVRYTVTMRSDAPESELLALVDKADRHSPLRDIFERPMKLKRTLKIKTGDD